METRALIQSQALKLFAARGYDAIGVQEICEASGITKPTLYHHFGNKRGLLDALLHERCEPWLLRLEQATEYRGDLPGTLQRTTEVCFQFAREEPLLSGLLLALRFAPPESEARPTAARINDRQRALLLELFRRAAQQHGNMRERHAVHAEAFLGLLQTYVGMALEGRCTLNDATARQAVQHFSYGIYS
ncbi:TetR family transcriptional regulator [Archangium primigenium]|uniref:TetR family transcriptional regulator n=1 Tax=[Archangium] primigenium TaxID=2792470 RepID=UPI00195A2438|nr:TetR/AcrR family transcriptional regulator [Archangium primigenium]